MSLNDAIRWNQRYLVDREKWNSSPRTLLTNNISLIPKQGLALDIAMGLGKNSEVLLNRGLNVIGVDISSVAVINAKRTNPKLMGVIADLTSFHFSSIKFDVIINFYYLQRELLGILESCIKPGGIIFIETLLMPMISIKPDLDPINLLMEGELINIFKDWEIIYYFEGWITKNDNNKKAIASLIARPHN